MISFFIYGHENVLCTHRNTIEFTKEADLSSKGDCILGVNADFDFDEMRNYIKDRKELRCIIEIMYLRDEFKFKINPAFDHKEEIVIRRSEYISNRTLGIKSTKAAIDIDRKIVELLKNPNEKAKVMFV